MRRLLPMLSLAIVLATACSSDSTSPNGTITGTYSLRTVNGSPLPYTVNFNTTIVSESLALYTDGTYQDVAHFSDGTSFTETGYYSQNNNALTFNDQTDRVTYQGSISGDVLTEINGGFTAAYQKD